MLTVLEQAFMNSVIASQFNGDSSCCVNSVVLVTFLINPHALFMHTPSPIYTCASHMQQSKVIPSHILITSLCSKRHTSELSLRVGLIRASQMHEYLMNPQGAYEPHHQCKFSNVIETRDGITFDFYTRLLHIYSLVPRAPTSLWGSLVCIQQGTLLLLCKCKLKTKMRKAMFTHFVTILVNQSCSVVNSDKE